MTAIGAANMRGMAHYLPLSRVARLVGQSRAGIQRMIHDGKLATFDGMVDMNELLRVFPDVSWEDDGEFRRVGLPLFMVGFGVLVESGAGDAANLGDDAYRARYLLGDLGLTGEEGTGGLSGGEAKRAALARALAPDPDILILDEPTNHLDIASREVLLEALQEFQGTVIIVSHDRYFLRHLVNRVFEIDHGHLNTFEGDYDYYLGKVAERTH